MNQVSDVLAHTRKLAKQDSNGITDADGISFANDALLELHGQLIERKKDLFLQESTRNVTANEIVGGSSPGKFLFPSDIFLLKSIEYNPVDLSAPSQDNYIPVSQYDAGNMPQGISLDYLRNNQNINDPLYDPHGDWFELVPTPKNVQTGGPLKINYWLAPTLFAATSDFLSYPYTLDFILLATKIVAVYFRAQEQWDQADKWDGRTDKRLDRIINIIGAGAQQAPQAKGINLTGWEF